MNSIGHQRKDRKCKNSILDNKQIMEDNKISNKTKIKLFDTNVKSVLLYGSASETWSSTQTWTYKQRYF